MDSVVSGTEASSFELVTAFCIFYMVMDFLACVVGIKDVQM